MKMKVQVLPEKWGFIGMPPRRYYGAGIKNRIKGDEFELERSDQFSHNWMTPIGWIPKGWIAESSDEKAGEKAGPLNFALKPGS